MKLHWELLLIALGLIVASEDLRAENPLVTLGSKKFTESVVLAELAAHLIQNAGGQTQHLRQLGGSRILWDALLTGEIDTYPEYTGTLRHEILANISPQGREDLQQILAERGLRMTQPLGFNNNYALGMKEQLAQELNIQTISDLIDHPHLTLGFSNEFVDRSDGWPGLQALYNLPQQEIRGLDHDLAYRGLESGKLQVIDLYSTDAEIQYYDIRVLEDDRDYFPNYQAIFLYRAELEQKAPAVVKALKRLEGKIASSTMVDMNARAKLDRVPESLIAADFLAENLGLKIQASVKNIAERLRDRTIEHLTLVSVSLSTAILTAIPLGILAAHRLHLGQLILGTAGIIQTIPSLALLVFMIPLLGIGGAPATVALFLYSLLPILRNTYAGLHDIPLPLRESAKALGLPPIARLRREELPMASRAILAGIKTSAVLNVGIATLGALIGAGGYGQPILTGIRLDDLGLILQGAVPAAILALLIQGFFELVERRILPKGLRLKPST